MYRINKRTARKMYNKGASFYICGNKTTPNLQNSILVNSSEYAGREFDEIADKYQRTWCNTNSGYYCAYWVDTEYRRTERNKWFKL